MARIFHYQSSTGAISAMTLLLVMIGLFAFVLAGGLVKPKNTVSTDSTGAPPVGYACCDSGSGDACTLGSNRFTWKGTNPQPEEYALIKSDIALTEGSGHLIDSQTKAPDGRRIFINTSNASANYGDKFSECPAGKDLVFGGRLCIGIPDDMIIYVCKTDCSFTEGIARFDAYYRVSDGAIPDAIKNCKVPRGLISSGKAGDQEIVVPTSDSKNNLQLKTFKVVQKTTESTASWLSPYCKPAVYLYPEKKSEISVKIDPVGPITYTDPLYPRDGWKVTAHPNGDISYQSKIYDYLYYEAQIPDGELEKPKQGYVIEKEGLSNLFESVLPKLGLNKKEKDQFAKYWLDVLPDSPFYFIGIVPEVELDRISPLDINPKPKNVIRVTLYFEPLEKKIDVSKPIFEKINRNGFTVVEWGGIYKSDKNHNFSCFQ